MHPILFKIFGFPIHSYGVMMIIAFFAALWLARRRAPANGLTAERVSDVSLYALLLGILGARVVFIAQEWAYYSHHLNEVFSIQFQGLTSFGGLLFGLIFVLLWCKRTATPVLNLLDVLAAPLLLGQAIGRVGCLLNGCCEGFACPATLPWGVHLNGAFVHPAQIYESIMDLAGLAILLMIERKGLLRGQSFALSLVLYGAARFIYEFWRAGESSTYIPGLPITDAQAVAGALVIVGITLLVVFRRGAHAQQEIPA